MVGKGKDEDDIGVETGGVEATREKTSLFIGEVEEEKTEGDGG